MSLINYKGELKLRWTQYYLLPATDNDNDDANSDNINFLKLCI